MTRNDPPNKLEWSIRPWSGVDSAQWEWGITDKPEISHLLYFGGVMISTMSSDIDSIIVEAILWHQVGDSMVNL